MNRESLRRHLHMLGMLSEAVTAMRSLSAHHFRTARAALPAARDYHKGVEAAIAAVGLVVPPPTSIPPAMLLVASDLGLCGSYNSKLVERGLELCCERLIKRTYGIGKRGVNALERAGQPVAGTYSVPTSTAGLTPLLLRLAEDLLRDYLSGAFGSLLVVSARFEGVGSCRPIVTQVLPIEPRSRSTPFIPSSYVSRRHLATVAIREFLYITLYEILLDALASEHGSRLVATEAAGEWLDTRIASTHRRLWAIRREESTQEVLDIAAGFVAIHGDQSGTGSAGGK